MTTYEKLEKLKKDKEYYLSEITKIDLENQQLQEQIKKEKKAVDNKEFDNTIKYIKDRVVFCYVEDPKDTTISVEATVVYDDKVFRQTFVSTLLLKDKFRFFSVQDKAVHEINFDNLVNPTLEIIGENVIKTLKDMMINRLAQTIVEYKHRP